MDADGLKLGTDRHPDKRTPSIASHAICRVTLGSKPLITAYPQNTIDG
jgi:hypothetical protein